VVIGTGGASRPIRSDADVMTLRFEVHVAGRLPQTLTEEIDTRFETVSRRNQPASTVLEGYVADQTSLRSLLTLIWDTNGSVLSLTAEPENE
jgi:hypothetical protein